MAITAIPSHAVRTVLLDIKRRDIRDLIWISVAKGIENNTLLRVSEVIAAVSDVPAGNIAVLFGPSHAEEVSRGIPTAIVAASTSQATAKLVQNFL